MVTPFPEAKTADTAEMGVAAAATGGSLGAALLPMLKESAAPAASSDAEAFRQLAEAALAAHAHGEAGPQEPHLLIRILQKAGSYASFSPMILVAVIPDIRVAALVAACVAVFNFLVATALRWRGVLKVWPTTFDLVNIAIYVVAMAASFTHPEFTRLWMPVWTSGLTGLYFLASLLVRRPFTVELAKESAPEWMWGNAAFYAMNFWISFAWAAGVLVTAACALAYVLLLILSGPDDSAYMALDVALGIAPLVLAIAAQHWLTRRFKGRVKAEVAKLVAERRSAAAAAPPAAVAV